MSVLTDRPEPPVLAPARRRRPSPAMVVIAAAVLLAVCAAGFLVVVRHAFDDSRRDFLATDGWPVSGQAAYAVDDAPAVDGPRQRPAPIASVAKVMTAFVVLCADPLAGDEQGFRMVVTAHDVADTLRRRTLDQSVVAVRRGETLTERDALAALLLPSANNVAVMLARHVAGSVPAFVAGMNDTARSLGMADTTYTDPSGYLASTVSTAADQLRLATAAMRLPAFAALVALRSYRLPFAGTVRSTDSLLGTDGIVGIKTGSTDAAGGCFAFRMRRAVHGRTVVVTGVVLGQQGRHALTAGLYAGRQLGDRVLARQ